MKKTLLERIPKKPERRTVSGKVRADLYDRVKPLLKKDKVEWQELIEAALEQFIEEHNKGA